MKQLTFDDLVDSLNSLTDSQLRILNQTIVDTIRQRRKTEGRKIAATLAVGDKVRIKHGCKPLYLQGQIGEVEAFRTEKITVRLVRGPQGKFRDGRVICPPSMLEKVED